MNSSGAMLPHWLLLSLMALFVAIGALMAWPEPAARLLVASDGWDVEGGFVALQAPDKDLRESATSNPQTRYWRSWNPDTGSQPGRVRSSPFVANGRIVVPYGGFSGDPGISSYLECASTGLRIYLATGRTNTQWTEVFLDPPADFCAGPVRVVAQSTSTQNYIAIGTPYELTWLSSFKQSTVASLWFVVFAWAVIAGWFMLFARIVARKGIGVEPLVGGLIGLGLIGYLQFFVFWFSPVTGKVVSALLVAIGLLWTVLVLTQSRRDDREREYLPVELRSATCLWLLVAVAYLALALIVDNGAGAWAINSRFAPARWSTDNQLPSFVARILVSGNHADLSDFSQWTIADRPPLAYGWHASLHAVLGQWLDLFGNGRHLFYLYQLTIGVILNTSWVMLLVVLLPRMGLSRFKSLLVLSVVTCSALFIFNSVFIWPKLLSATFTLMAAWILLGIDPYATRLRNDNHGLVAAAMLCALGLLTHGGSAFGIAVAVGLAALYRGLPSFKGAAVAGIVALALLLPWSLWQSHVQPPGNALVKFAFGGTFGFGEENVGALDTIVRSYHALTPDAWLHKKWDGLLSIVFGIRNTCGLNEMGVIYSSLDRWRASDFYYVMPSLNFLLLGFIALIGNRSKHPAVLASRKLAFFALTTIVLCLLTTWDCFINHHQSYQALVALQVGLVVLLLSAGRLGMLALALNIAYGLAVWVFEPFGHFPRFDYVAMAALVLCVSLWMILLHRARNHGLGTTH